MLDLDKVLKDRWNKHPVERKMFGGGLIFGSIIIISIFIIYIVMKNTLNDFEDTHNNELKGKVFSIKIYQGSSWIKLHKDSSSFVLLNSYNYSMSEPKLHKFLKVGDSIYKPVDTDSLYIYRNGKEYLFILGNLTYNLNE